MKHQLLLLFLLSVSTSLMAKVKGYPTIFSEYKEEVQQAHPDAQADSILTTNIWMTYYHTADGEYAFAKYKATLSDSIIAGKEYMKVIVENRDTLLYRQEGDKVYMCWDGQEFLILDYGLKEGDTFEDAWGEKFLVTKCFTFDTQNEYYGSWRKCRATFIGPPPKFLHLQSLEDSTHEDEWQEGMGSVEWGIIPFPIFKKLKAFAQEPSKAHLTYGNSIGTPLSNRMFCQMEMIEEDYATIPFNHLHGSGYEVSYSFSADTLCIMDKAFIGDHLNTAECEIKGNTISINTTSEYDDWKSYYYFNLKIYGIKAGKYDIYLNGKLRREALACEDTDGIEGIKKGGNPDILYDLSGRRTTQPAKGIYIRQGRKVVK